MTTTTKTHLIQLNTAGMIEDGKTRCGKSAEYGVSYTANLAEVTCKSCERGAARVLVVTHDVPRVGSPLRDAKGMTSTTACGRPMRDHMTYSSEPTCGPCQAVRALDDVYADEAQRQATELQELEPETSRTVDTEKAGETVDVTELVPTSHMIQARQHFDSAERDTSPLTRLLELACAREQLELLISETVEQARANGSSWQEIAYKIGGTKQAAQQRYGKKAR